MVDSCAQGVGGAEGQLRVCTGENSDWAVGLRFTQWPFASRAQPG